MGELLHCAPVEDESHIGAARRAVQKLAEEHDIDGTLKGKVGIVTTELATNIRRHAGRGEIFSRPLDGPTRGIEILAVDRGGGISDITRALEDGYSTAGTQGTGLGSIRRLSNEFDIFSEVGRGTVVLSRIYAGQPGPVLAWRWGVVETCAPGEVVCGDSWTVLADQQSLGVMVADGLGHGPLAHESGELAMKTFESHPRVSPKAYLIEADRILRASRGAAIAAGYAQSGDARFSYAGVGNIAGSLASGDGISRGLVSFNGTAGAEMHTVREMEYVWEVGTRLIMHSDGIQSRWTLRDRPGLLFRHPSIIAAVIYRDFRRGRDDATVLVVERTR